MQNKTPEGKEKSMPTTEQELEKYGVWVKAEPQDIIEEPETEHELLDDLDSMDLTMPEPEAANEETFLSEAEEISLDSLDEINGSEDDSIIDIPLDDLDYDLPATEIPEKSKKMESTSTDTLMELSLDDFDMGGLDESNELKPESSTEKTETLDLAEFGLSDEDTPASGTDESAEDEFETIDIDLQFDDTIPSAADSANSTNTEFNLDDVEDMNSISPDIFLETNSSEEESVLGMPASEGVLHEDVTEDFTGLGKSVRIPLAAASGKHKASSITTGVDSFIDSDQNEESFMPTIDLDGAKKTVRKTGFDDLQAVENDLAGGSQNRAPQDISSSMLEQIARELSSIKQELVSLRSQLKEIKDEPKSASSAGENVGETVNSAEESPAGGFFDDEDDETIALTGDELDNILNTADFTEESADDIQTDVTVDETVSFDTELLPEDGDYLKAGPGIETINLAEENLLEETAIETNNLEPIDFDDILSPITPAPDDTSYLDLGEEEFPDGELALEPAALDDVPLIEPDLSEIDFGEELPLIELSHEDQGGEPSSDDVIEEIMMDDSEDDLILSIDGEEPNLDSSAAANYASIPEIEEPEELLFEDDDSSLDLHTEESSGMPSEDSLIKPAVPVQIHPDELSMSLDDSLFVGQNSSDETAQDIATEDFDFPEIIEMDSGLETPAKEPAAPVQSTGLPNPKEVPDKLKHDIKSVLLYLDQLLSALPEEKIEEFAASEYYDTYKNLFDELGIL